MLDGHADVDEDVLQRKYNDWGCIAQKQFPSLVPGGPGFESRVGRFQFFIDVPARFLNSALLRTRGKCKKYTN